jgi:Restriction Enzyme Adenine Methylase Associated
LAMVGTEGKPMARRRRNYKVEMADLISAGKIRPSGRLHANHHGKRYEAVVTERGDLRLPHEPTGLSPSAAAKRITGRDTNGWAFWLVDQPDGTARSLRRLRAELLADHSG